MHICSFIVHIIIYNTYIRFLSDFCNMAPNLAFPPQPILTLWGTWLNLTKGTSDHPMQ